MNTIIENKGIKTGTFYIAPFNLQEGELVVLYLYNGETPNQIYTDLAWGGLRGTPIYNEIFPIGSEAYIRLESRYGAESNGGTSGNQTAIGKPCKI